MSKRDPRFLRIFSPSEKTPSLDGLRRAVPDGAFEPDVEYDSSWTELRLTDEEELEYAVITRDAPGGEFFDDEIEAFSKVLELSGEPANAAAWARTYLGTVRSIYAFEIMYAEQFAWPLVRSVRDAVLKTAGGIFQMDGEGFSNTDGSHITWDFPREASGERRVAILDGSDWQTFVMNLHDRDHVAAFKAGRVPKGVEIE